MTTALEPILPRSLTDWAAEAEAAAGIARSLAGTSFIPDSLKVWTPERRLDLDATVAQTAAALLTGQELGLSPMASLRSIDIIPPGSGSPALRAAALRGLLQHHNHEIWVVESTDTRAVVRGRRAGSDIVMESVWTIDRARKMELRGFGQGGNWRRQPASMLVARATAECARWIASDVLLGLPYIAEEIADQPEDGTGPELASLPAGPNGDAAPPSPTAGPRRRAARRGPSQAPPAGRARPLALLPPGPAAALPEDGDGQESEPAAPATPRISAAQRAALWAAMRRLGITDRDEALATVSGWIGRDVASSNQLSETEASTALKAAAAEQERRAAREDQDAEAEAPQEVPDGPEADPDD